MRLLQRVQAGHERLRVAQLIQQAFQLVRRIREGLRGARFVRVLHFADRLFQEVADLAVFAARFDRLVHLRQHFLQLVLGEVALFQLIDHFLQRRHGGLGLAFVQLLGEVFAQLRLLPFQVLERLGHRLHFFQVLLGDLQIFEELVDLTAFQRLDRLL